MGAIRIICGMILALLAMPACAQTAPEQRLGFTVPHIETRVMFDERSRGLWLRAATVLRGESEQGAADGRTRYRFSLQKQVIGHAWIGIGGYTQLPRFDPVRGRMRGQRNAVGPKLSFEAGGDVEMGILWMKRKKRGGVPPGPRAYVQFHF